MTVAAVRLWGTDIGAVSVDGPGQPARFQFTDDFLATGVELAPLTMPAANRVYSFPTLNPETFKGLPGMLADVLPDRFGNLLIDAWLASQGRRPESFDAVERLCYTGTRGMGALEFMPQVGPRASDGGPIDLSQLVELASEALASREALTASFADADRQRALTDILSVGTSAGGARAKAVIAYDPASGEVRSGQADTRPGFEHWLLKFDGVTGNRDKEQLADPQGYGLIEYAYHLMAVAAGLDMTECRILEEGERRHFMTRRFDRTADGDKVHMQSLCAIGHMDFNMAGAYSYEGAFMVANQLGLPRAAAEQLFRRMVFNVVARNQDDHTKNIAFLMGRDGVWQLAPAFDVTWAYGREWTARHQMTVAGKRDNFTAEDLEAAGKVAFLKRGRATTILEEVTAAVRDWPKFADAAGVPEDRTAAIASTHRLALR